MNGWSRRRVSRFRVASKLYARAPATNDENEKQQRSARRNRIFFHIVSLSIWLRYSASRSMSKNETKREKMKIVIEGMKNAHAIGWQKMNVAMKAKISNENTMNTRETHILLWYKFWSGERWIDDENQTWN